MADTTEPKAPESSDGAKSAEGTPEVRADRVSQAVKFLSDQRVSTAPMERAVGFLRRKGLTGAEIRTAFQQLDKTITPEAEEALTSAEPPPAPQASATTAPATAAAPSGAAVAAAAAPSANGQPVYYYAQPPVVAQQPPPPPPPKRAIWKDVLLYSGSVAGLLLFARELLKKYVMPMYFPDNVEGKRLQDVQHEVKTLGHSVQSVQDALREASTRGGGMPTREEMREISHTLQNCTKQMKELSAQNASMDVIRARLDTLMMSLSRSDAGGGVGRAALPVAAAQPAAEALAAPRVSATRAVEAARTAKAASDNAEAAAAVAASAAAVEDDEDFFSIAPGKVETFGGVRRLPTTAPVSSPRAAADAAVKAVASAAPTIPVNTVPVVAAASTAAPAPAATPVTSGSVARKAQFYQAMLAQNGSPTEPTVSPQANPVYVNGSMGVTAAPLKAAPVLVPAEAAVTAAPDDAPVDNSASDTAAPEGGSSEKPASSEAQPSSSKASEKASAQSASTTTKSPRGDDADIRPVGQV